MSFDRFRTFTGLPPSIVYLFSQLSSHSTATMGIAMSLKDGSLNLSNSWTRQLSETATGNVLIYTSLHQHDNVNDVIGKEAVFGGWES